MTVLVVPPAEVRVGDLLYGPDATKPGWPEPRTVVTTFPPGTVVHCYRRWPAIWRLQQARVVGYMVELRAAADECGEFDMLHAATVRIQR